MRSSFSAQSLSTKQYAPNRRVWLRTRGVTVSVNGGVLTIDAEHGEPSAEPT